MSGGGTESAGDHPDLASPSPDQQHRLGRVFIEGAMQPADECYRGRLGQVAGRVAPVDLALHPDMRACLELKVAALAGGIELIRQRALDLARRRVVALDQVRIVAVHHPHGSASAAAERGCRRAPRALRRSRQRGDQIDDLGGGFVQAGRARSATGFQEDTSLPILKMASMKTA